MTTKRKTILTAIVFGAAAPLLIISLILPMVSGIKNESQNLVSQKNKISELADKFRNIGAVEAEFNKYNEFYGKIASFFVDAKEPISFIEFLEEQADSSRVSIEITPLGSQMGASEPWPSINFRLSAKGGFSNFSIFLERLESAPYLVEVLNININRAAEEDGGGISAAFLIKVYSK